METINNIISNHWEGLLGVLITIVGVIVTIYYAKHIKRPCKLEYYPFNEINLHNNLANQFKNLSITYNNAKIENNIIYISGFLLSNGKKDICKAKKNHDINIALPKNSQWLEVKITPSDKNISSHIRINNKDPRIAILSFRDLRINENIRIKALIESKDPINYSNRNLIQQGLSFYHRIDETDNVRLMPELEIYTPFKQNLKLFFKILFRKSSIVTFAICIVGIFLLSFSVGFDIRKSLLALLGMICGLVSSAFFIPLIEYIKGHRIKRINNIIFGENK